MKLIIHIKTASKIVSPLVVLKPEIDGLPETLQLGDLYHRLIDRLNKYAQDVIILDEQPPSGFPKHK